MRQGMSTHGGLTRVLLGLTASLALVVGLVSAAVTVRWLQLRDVGVDRVFHRADPDGGAQPVDLDACAEQTCNYLLLGSDSRVGLTAAAEAELSPEFGQRADTIMLVHTDPRLQKAIVVSFPRDLWVEIPGRGQDRINSAFDGGIARGGAQRMAETVANLSGLPIDHYLYVDLHGFQRVVDTLGGVQMCIPSYHVNTPGWLPATLPTGEPTRVYYSEVGYIADANAGLLIKPGCQRLGGAQALAYVRARHLPCDSIPDFARIGRQQQFLRAVVNQMLRPSTIVKAPSLVRPTLAAMHRDSGLTPSDLIYLVGQLQGLSTGAVEFRAIPGTAAFVDGKSVLRVDPSAREIFDAIRGGRPLGRAGTELINTPPSEATTVVAVVDAESGGTASSIEQVLADAGFDVSPGIWSPSEGGISARRAAIVYRPAARARADVVAAYLPDLPLVASTDLRGAQVAVVVPASYEFVPPGDGPTAPGAAECPSSA
jgi:anionic cell wall polymer biosynthesis LytR-Cps2A-Psr (LCP) family protein